MKAKLICFETVILALMHILPTWSIQDFFSFGIENITFLVKKIAFSKKIT